MNQLLRQLLLLILLAFGCVAQEIDQRNLTIKSLYEEVKKRNLPIETWNADNEKLRREFREKTADQAMQILLAEQRTAGVPDDIKSAALWKMRSEADNALLIACGFEPRIDQKPVTLGEWLAARGNQDIVDIGRKLMIDALVAKLAEEKLENELERTETREVLGIPKEVSDELFQEARAMASFANIPREKRSNYIKAYVSERASK